MSSIITDKSVVTWQHILIDIEDSKKESDIDIFMLPPLISLLKYELIIVYNNSIAAAIIVNL